MRKYFHQPIGLQWKGINWFLNIKILALNGLSSWFCVFPTLEIVITKSKALFEHVLENLQKPSILHRPIHTNLRFVKFQDVILSKHHSLQKP